jgi:hypothetical protein
VVGFNCIVRLLLRDAAGGGQQLIEHSQIRGSPVGAHLGRAWAVVERLAEEPVSGREISFFRDEDIDDLAELVDRSVQMDSSSSDFEIGLVDKPPIAGYVPAGSCRVDRQRCEPLHPPVDRD